MVSRLRIWSRRPMPHGGAARALRSSPTMPPEWPPKPSQADIDRLEKAAWDSGTEAVLVWYRDEIERLKAERS